ncbi:MAG: hypothetical protein A2086_03325 [Spirochaetes bacterium GWD1_27_9]|nr:MAG: hypothetical protein A2Z98_12555 [Spirochaetes bacterium GWB1_27_13]OHD45280.1 MAG: hypothetical protein A2086_03325 [Spirochaetes bacterium GWD1_27_9]
MIRDDLSIIIERNKKSYDYKYNSKRNDLANNSKNNSLDTLILYQNGKEVFRHKRMQTVSNYNLFDSYDDTIAPGKFKMKHFVEKRAYTEDIHGIFDCYDIEGQYIKEDSTQIDDGIRKGRYLGHSDEHKGKAVGCCYSAGCIMFLGPENLVAYNKKVRELGVKDGDVICGEIREV